MWSARTQQCPPGKDTNMVCLVMSQTHCLLPWCSFTSKWLYGSPQPQHWCVKLLGISGHPTNTLPIRLPKLPRIKSSLLCSQTISSSHCLKGSPALQCPITIHDPTGSAILGPLCVHIPGHAHLRAISLEPHRVPFWFPITSTPAQTSLLPH